MVVCILNYITTYLVFFKHFTIFRAKEAALAQRPNLETVTEEGEEEAPSKEKDSNGQTELHRLAAQEGKVVSLVIISLWKKF